jgi:hypothetical protein
LALKLNPMSLEGRARERASSCCNATNIRNRGSMFREECFQKLLEESPRRPHHESVSMTA